MQQQELQLKAAEQQRKSQKDQVDAQLKAAQIQVERDRIAATTKIEGAKAILQTTSQKKNQMVSLGVGLLKDKLNRDQSTEAQKRDLFARGLDNAHKHASTKKKGD